MNYMPIVIHLDEGNATEALTQFADHQTGVLLCLTGSASFQLGVKVCHVMQGDMMVLDIFANVSLKHISSDFKGSLCIVNLESIFSAVTPSKLFSNMKFLMLHPISHPSEQDFSAMLSILGLIEERSQCYDKRPLSRMTTDSLINALTFLILDSYVYVRQTAIKSSDTKEAIMLAFHDALIRDYASHRNVAYYASLQNLSPRYFSTTIKTVSGYTPSYWINTVVIAKAKRMMRNTNMNIKEVAYKLNFTSPTFFTRWYRELTGETPSDYRTRYRITIANDTPVTDERENGSPLPLS